MLSSPSRRCWGSPSGALHHWEDQRYSAALRCVPQLPSCPVVLCCPVWLSGPVLCYSVAHWPCLVLLSCPVLCYLVAQWCFTQWPNVTQSPCVTLRSVPVLHYLVASCCVTQWPCVVTSGPVLRYSVALHYSAAPWYLRSAGTRPAAPAGPAGWRCTRRWCARGASRACMRSRPAAPPRWWWPPDAAPGMASPSPCSLPGDPGLLNSAQNQEYT